ncbi:MAG: hypothetical protein WCW53_07910 [Syntrophales bacterium]|jgi:hypothetical protein
MDHISADKEWQKLQVHIDQRFGRYLRDGLDLKDSERHGVFGVKSVPKTTVTAIKGESTNEKNA